MLLSYFVLTISFISNPLDIDWNIFASSNDPEFSYIGYGDWCIASEGAHPGIDFHDPTLEVCSTFVISPLTNTSYIRVCDIDDLGIAIVLSEDPMPIPSSGGWQIAHLAFDSDFPLYLNKQVSPGDTLSYLWTPTPSNIEWYWFAHVHLNWNDPISDSYGIVHPFDYLIPPSGYDDLVFRQIPSYFETFSNRSTGIVFDLQDGNPSLDETGNVVQWHGQGGGAYKLFQNWVYGKVDFIVAPASLDCLPPVSDSLAGVRKLEVEVLYQEGSEWVGTAYSKRTVFDFSYPIPFADVDEYYALFFDPPTPSEPNFHWHMNSSYIASNSGNNSTFETSYDNIWPSTNPSLVHNWSTGSYNQGCWDTEMRDPSKYQPGYPDQAFVPENAAFPDGRYAVKVTATTHGGVTGSMILPKARIERPDSPTIGVLVDNFYPHVTAVTVTSNDELFYSAQYTVPSLAKPNQTERTLNNNYEPRDSSFCLEAEISFSEAVVLDSVWIEAVAGDFTNWSSEMVLSTYNLDGYQSCYSLISENPAPEGYLGRFVLNIEAHDLSPMQYELDSLPTTIPFPHKSGMPDDGCYEPGVTIFEWNTAYFNIGGVPNPDGYIDGWFENTASPVLFFNCDLLTLFNHPSADCYLKTPLSTSTNYNRRGFCEEYAGFWTMPANEYGIQEFYDKIHLCYPANTSSGWDKIAFSLPFAYPPKPAPIRNNIRSTPIDQDRPVNLQQSSSSVSQTGCNQPNYSDYSTVTGARSTYSDGAYCFVSWIDREDGEPDRGYLACISSKSLQTRVIGPVSPTFIIWGGGTEDWIEVKLQGSYEYYHPYSPQFFPEENPNPEENFGSFLVNCTGVEGTEEGLNLSTAISTPYPNPATTSAAIPFSLANSGIASIQVFDLSGRTVAMPANQNFAAGQHTINWNLESSNGTAVPNGFYSVVVTTTDKVMTERIMVIR